jgi:hypothetical protein
MSVTGDFTRKDPSDENAKWESICTKCSQRISAYTAETLSSKELEHACPGREPESHPTPATQL